jgi:hypothetical protein
MNNCAICNEIVQHSSHYYRKHGLKLSEYFLKYFPRYDLYSGQAIPFTTIEEYMTRMFINRQHMLLFLQQDKVRAARTIWELMMAFKEQKQAIFSPSTVEARTSEFVPSPKLCGKLGLDFNVICEQAGLKNRYDYSTVIEIGDDERASLNIIADTREQKQLKFKSQVISSALAIGDYTSVNKDYSGGNIFIERKSASDFISTIGGQFERFKRELSRVCELGVYLVIACEADLAQMLNFDTVPYLARFTNSSPKYIFHRVKELCQEYGQHCQFVFCPRGRPMGQFIENIFLIREQDVRKLDLEFLVNMGAL